MTMLSLAILALCVLGASAQPFQPGTGFVPLGNLRTSDRGGPYNLSLLSTQANEIKGGILARGSYTDKDLVDFLVNVECLEGLFDTWGTFGRGFLNDLEMGGPTPIGAQKANLSPQAESYMQEVALNEQGHALLTRQAGSTLPCPAIDFVGGFSKFYAAAFGLPHTATAIKDRFGRDFNPFENDETFVTSVLALEELGATGNKGLSGLFSNPVLATAVAGLATSANSQATIQRVLLWERRNNTVPPFGETVQQVFARISALRDSLDGPQINDQGLVNTDPRFIAVPASHINLIPTDVRGLTFNRSPQQLINILTLGNPKGVGVFFPNGLGGAITKPTGFDQAASGLDDFPATTTVASQQTTAQVGTISPPITDTNEPSPRDVPGVLVLTQALDGPTETASYTTRGFTNTPITNPLGNSANTSTVETGTPSGPAPAAAKRTLAGAPAPAAAAAASSTSAGR